MLTVAIGDIHGCLKELEQLVERVQKNFSDPIQWITIGDYVDRGPDSKGVIDFVRNLKAIALKGNHEDMLVKAYRGAPYQRYEWDQSYGRLTTPSFGVTKLEDIPLEYILWMERLPYFHIEYPAGDMQRVFVHAGIQRRYPVTMQSQNRDYMIWARDEFLLDERMDGGYVVHGHTPVCHLVGVTNRCSNRVNLDLGCCFGGLLTAAVFQCNRAQPVYTVSHTGKVSAFE